MNTTLKQQIYAVKRAREIVYTKLGTSKIDRQLNDACSTLAAVEMIGEDKIKALPQILSLACEICRSLNTPYNPGKTREVILLYDLLHKMELLYPGDAKRKAQRNEKN